MLFLNRYYIQPSRFSSIRRSRGTAGRSNQINLSTTGAETIQINSLPSDREISLEPPSDKSYFVNEHILYVFRFEMFFIFCYNIYQIIDKSIRMDPSFKNPAINLAKDEYGPEKMLERFVNCLFFGPTSFVASCALLMGRKNLFIVIGILNIVWAYFAFSISFLYISTSNSQNNAPKWRLTTPISSVFWLLVIGILLGFSNFWILLRACSKAKYVKCIDCRENSESLDEGIQRNLHRILKDELTNTIAFVYFLPAMFELPLTTGEFKLFSAFSMFLVLFRSGKFFIEARLIWAQKNCQFIELLILALLSMSSLSIFYVYGIKTDTVIGTDPIIDQMLSNINSTVSTYDFTKYRHAAEFIDIYVLGFLEIAYFVVNGITLCFFTLTISKANGRSPTYVVRTAALTLVYLVLILMSYILKGRQIYVKF